MEKFGFTLSKARVIDYDANDRRIVDFILEREPSLKACIECGCCTATCTTGNFTGFSLREIHVLLKRGENDQVREKNKKMHALRKMLTCLSKRCKYKECCIPGQTGFSKI